MKSPLSLFFFYVVQSLMMSLLDDIIIFLSRLFWYLGFFRHFSVDLLNKFENFISVIIIDFIFYDFSLVIFLGFVGGMILSLFKVLLRIFSDTRYYTFNTIHKIILHQWRAVIGIFNCRMSVVSTNCECKLSRNFVTMLEILLLCYYYLESTYLSNVIIYVYISAVSWRY